MDNWNEMTVAEKNEQSSIHSFTCAAHNYKINNMAIAMTSASAKFLYRHSEFERYERGQKTRMNAINYYASMDAKNMDLVISSKLTHYVPMKIQGPTYFNQLLEIAI